jgi:hypothetical protein
MDNPDDSKTKEIQEIRQQESAGTNAAKREAAQERKKQRDIAKQALRAKIAKDARGFREMLKRAGVSEGSAGWKEAWKFFYD